MLHTNIIDILSIAIEQVWTSQGGYKDHIGRRYSV